MQNLVKSMPPSPLNERGNSESPLPRLKTQLNSQHPLFKLAQALDWDYFEQEFRPMTTPEGGRPSLPVRLMVGLHYLKALYNESDESVVMKWVENPYWQYFCGEETFQHSFPCHLFGSGDSRSRTKTATTSGNRTTIIRESQTDSPTEKER